MRISTNRTEIDALLVQARDRNLTRELVRITTDSIKMFQDPTIFLIEDSKELLTSFSDRGRYFAWSFLSSSVKPTQADFENALTLGLPEVLSQFGHAPELMSGGANSHCPWMFETNDGVADTDLVTALVNACNQIIPGIAIELDSPIRKTIDRGDRVEDHGTVWAHTVPIRGL